MFKHLSLYRSLYLVLLDSILLILALLIATWMRYVIPIGLEGTLQQRLLPLPVYIMALILYQVAYSLLNVHSPRQSLHLMRELQRLTAGTLLGWLMLLGALYLSYRDTSRMQIAYFIGVHLLLIYSTRLILRLNHSATHQDRQRAVLIVGTNALAQQMYTLVQQHTWAGLRPVGLILAPSEQAPQGLPVLGELDALESLVQQHHVREVVIAVPRDNPLDLPALVNRLQALPVNIRLVPQYSDLAFLQVYIEDFSGMPLLTLKEPVLTPYQRLLKRLFDLVVCVALLIPALPLMALIALLIRIDSKGSVIFRQVRIGEGGKPFAMYKFRSMIEGAEFQQEQVKRYDADGNPIYKHPNDPRVTRVGRWLRISSLDELPQLLNILKGDMSLVGPRPEMPDQVSRYAAWQRKRFEVPQGLTGWWQVNGRADKPMHLSTEDDLFYIRNYSLWLDIQILWRTIWTVIARRGAY